jgi:LysR family transcriptional regulator, nod-box dependent transcriptional activator
MRFHQLDLNLLVALDALLAERNITLAGQRLHLSQSAMSSGLARLRDYFGDELLIQVGRKMQPTPLGESMVGPLRRILNDIQANIVAKPGFDPATSQRVFSIMMSDYAASVLMTRVARHAARVAPQVSFELLSNNVEAPDDVLNRGDVDLLVMPAQALTSEHPKLPLFVDDYVCIAWSGNPVVGDSMTLDEYLGLGHVVLQFSRGRVPTVDEWVLKQLGHVRRTEVIAMNFNLLAQFVVGTNRIATLQRRLAQYYAQVLPLKLLLPPLKLPSLTQCVHWNQAFDHDPGSVWLRNLLKQVAQDESEIVSPPAGSHPRT